MESAEVGKAFDRVNAHLQTIDQRLDRVEQILPTIDQRLDRVEQILPAIDQRLGRVEQILPTLATSAELAQATKEEGERSRRHMDVLFESLRGELHLYAEAWQALDQRDARQHADTTKALAGLDQRVTGLEARARKRR
jgi:prefoldin subunit 5